MDYYDFESDMEYQLQFHETLKSRAAVQCNKTATDEYFRYHFQDFAVSNDDKHARLNPLCFKPGHMPPSVQKFLHVFNASQPLLPQFSHINRVEPIEQHESQVQYVQILRNLKQRIADVIKERNAHYKLKRQVAIMDSLSDLLETDPMKVLAIVGYQAILKNDEFHIPKTAKNIDPDYARRYERKRQEMAEAFCLLQISRDVIQSCDKFDDNTRNGRFGPRPQ